MLQAIREKAQGWIAWAIVILITIPFALWGIQEYLGVSGETVVAEVDGQPINDQTLEENARRFREQLRSSLGAAYKADLFSEAMLRRQALDQMIDERVLQVTAKAWGMRASDQMVVDAIASDRAFQSDGRFDHDLYQTVLRNNGLSEAAYEVSMRQGLTLEQLQSGISDSSFSTRAEVEAFHRLLNQKRTASYAVVPAASYLDKLAPDDAAVQAYYEAHQGSYQVPERVKLDYLLLDIAGLSAAVTVNDGDLAAYFEQHRDEFVAPQERELRHILIPFAGDEAAAQAKAAKLRQQLQEGADFAALARDNSADPGSAPQGGSLGWVSRGMMVDAFEQAAFALGVGEISEPVKTPFGYHLIQLQAVRGGGEARLEDIREQVASAYRKSEAERAFFARAERLAELAYENPDNLELAAEELGLSIQHSDWLARSGGQGDLASPKVVAAAFSDDVLQGNNSELLELGPEKLLVLRVTAHEDARARALDEVRTQVLAAVRQQQATAQAKADGEQAMTRLQGGASLSDVAAASKWTLSADQTFDRQQRDVPAAVRDLAFRLARPEGASPVVGGVALANGDYALVALSAVADGEVSELDDTARKQLANRIAGMSGRLQLSAMVRALRDSADVRIMLDDKASAE